MHGRDSIDLARIQVQGDVLRAYLAMKRAEHARLRTEKADWWERWGRDDRARSLRALRACARAISRRGEGLRRVEALGALLEAGLAAGARA